MSFIREQPLSLIKRAAAERGQDVTEFVLDSAYSEAQQTLADRHSFTLPPEQWEAFLAALDRPPRVAELLEPARKRRR